MSTNTSDSMMKAMAMTSTRTALEKVTIPKPTPSEGELLVKVSYSAIDTALDQTKEGGFIASFVRDMKATPLLAGFHYSGVVEQVGKPLSQQTETSFQIGDKVFGHLEVMPSQRQGAFSEYIVVKMNQCAVLPASVDMAEAAGGAIENTTALQALHDHGGLKEGKSVLIMGAGGGVGKSAVGLAKALGAAEIIAVCSTKDVDRVKELGADIVIDRKKHENVLRYLKKDLKKTGKIDVIFDTPNQYSFWKSSSLLRQGGVFVITLPTMEKLLGGWILTILSRRKFEWVECHSIRNDLKFIGRSMEDGLLKIDIDSIHDVKDVNEAWQRFGEVRSGRVVIKVAGGW